MQRLKSKREGKCWLIFS